MEAGRNDGNLLYLLHLYCDSISRLLEKEGFQGFGKYASYHQPHIWSPACMHQVIAHCLLAKLCQLISRWR